MVATQHELNGREKILEAARDLFSRHGFHQTSMAELAGAAKISVGQIYRHFSSKDAIIEAIAATDADSRSDFMRLLGHQVKTGEIDAEEAFARIFALRLGPGQEALSFDILAESFRNDPVRETIVALGLRYRELLRDLACATNPALSDEALDGVEEMLLACLFGLGHRSVVPSKLAPEAMAKRAARTIVQGLRAIH